MARDQSEFSFAEPRPLLDELTKFVAATGMHFTTMGEVFRRLFAGPHCCDHMILAAIKRSPLLEDQSMSEAIFNQSAIVEVTRDTVAELKRQAQRAPRGRFRLCMHQRLDDQVQEMVIVCGRGTYFRPHRHPAGKSESYHVIEGAMSVFFSDNGEVIRRIKEHGRIRRKPNISVSSLPPHVAPARSS